MIKREVYCDVCGEKENPFCATRMVIKRVTNDKSREMDLCETCTTWLLDLIADRQVEKSTTS